MLPNNYFLNTYKEILCIFIYYSSKHLKSKFYFVVKSEAKFKKKLTLQIYFKEKADIVASQIYSYAVCQ